MTPDPIRPTADLLDQHGAFLHRLAVGLVGDEHLAADLVQETVLRAHTRAPARVDSWRAWLRRVLANLAGDARRRADRRRLREERAARPEALPATGEMVARQELLLQVLQAVQAQAEPYRSTLHYRFYEELTPAAIAERLGVPRETVKARLRRGLERLREELDRRHRGDRRAWLAGLAAWTGEGELAATAGVASPLASAGVVLMTVKSKLIWALPVLLVALASLLYWLPDGEEMSPDADPPTPPLAGTVTPPPPRTRERTPQPSRSGARTLLAETGEGKMARLEIRLHWKEDGKPADRVRLVLSPCFLLPVEGMEFPPDRMADTDSRGRAILTDLKPGDYTLKVARGRQPTRQVTLVAGRPERLSIALNRLDPVEGVVVDEAGAPVAGATLHLGPVHKDWNLDHRAGTAGPDGRFTLAGVSADLVVYARAPGYGPTRPEPPGTGLRLVLPRARAEVELTVLAPSGEPRAGAEARLYHEGRERTLASGATLPLLPLEGARSDRQGVIRLQDLAPEPSLLVVQAPGLAPWTGRVDPAAGETHRLTVRLQAGATLQGRVTDDRDRPIANVIIAWVTDFHLPDHRTMTDKEGCYTLRRIQPGRRRIRITSTVGSQEETLDLAPGQVRRLDVTFDRLITLQGRLFDAGGRPLGGCRLELRAAGPTDRKRLRHPHYATTDARGGFTLPRCPRVGYALTVSRKPNHHPLWQRTGLTAGDFPLRIVLPAGALRHGAIVGRLVDPAGRPVQPSIVLYDQRCRTRAEATPKADGSFRFDRLPPGTWWLAGNTPTLRRYHLGGGRLEAGATLDLGPLVVAPPGALRVTLDRPGPHRLIFHRPDRTPQLFSCPEGESTHLCRGLQPDRYVLEVRGEHPPVFAKVDIPAGKALGATLRIPRGVHQVLRFTGRSDEAPQDYLLVVEDRAGRRVCTRMVVGRGRVFEHRVWLRPGEYEVILKAIAPSGCGAHGTIRVPVGRPPTPAPVPFR